MHIISISDNCKILENDKIVEFYIQQDSPDFLKIKNLCKINKPFNIIFIWESYMNIEYGILLESFIMENCSFEIGTFSSFYGKCEDIKRLNEKQYKSFSRKSKIESILSEKEDKIK